MTPDIRRPHGPHDTYRACTARRSLLRGPALAALLAAALHAAPARAQVDCVADFSGPMGRQAVRVQIVPRADGRFDARVDGALSHEALVPLDQPVRSDLNPRADPYGEEYRAYNEAERSIVSLHTQASLPRLFDDAAPPFAPGQVRRARIFDLVGRSDKFGGHVLIEAYGEGDRLLGTLVRRLVTVPCRPRPASAG
jgi:hypothetical protein